MSKFSILYKKSTKGAIQQWQIFVDGASYYTEAGQVGSKITRSLPTETFPKNIGKQNATTAEDQAIVEAAAKHEKKLKEGYVEDLARIDEIKFIKPMLAYPIKERKIFNYPIIVNYKYNGVRCIFTKMGAFSRKGEEFFNVQHIKDELSKVFSKYPNLVLDGELNDPNDQQNLNRVIKLLSTNRKEKDITEDLKLGSLDIIRYTIYDGYFEKQEDEPYSERFINGILGIIKGLKYSFPAKFWYAQNTETVEKFFDDAVKDGWEGIILRTTDSPYEHKRSKNLLKVKKFEDAEFEIVDIQEGTGNWAGAATGIFCKLEKEYHHLGKTEFTANLDGTMENAREILKNRKQYIGKKVTVRFQGRSEYGVPLIPYTSGEIRFD